MHHRERSKLRALLERGQLPSSQCGARFLRSIATLLDTGVVREMRVGGGAALCIVHREAVQRFHDKLYPTPAVDAMNGSRAEGVANYRSSKALPNDTPIVLNTRVRPGSTVRIGDLIVEDGTATARDGVYAIRLSTSAPPEIQGNWVLIENPALFHVHERVFGNDCSAILLNGRTPDRVIHWLAAQRTDNLHLVHAPDYDPVGLDEFDRLHRVLGERIILYVPDGIEERFARYSNRTLLLHDRQQVFLRKHAASGHPAVAHIAALIRKYNAGLEQEVLLLNDRGRERQADQASGAPSAAGSPP